MQTHEKRSKCAHYIQSDHQQIGDLWKIWQKQNIMLLSTKQIERCWIRTSYPSKGVQVLNGHSSPVEDRCIQHGDIRKLASYSSINRDKAIHCSIHYPIDLYSQCSNMYCCINTKYQLYCIKNNTFVNA